jgi:hypothetical protein
MHLGVLLRSAVSYADCRGNVYIVAVTGCGLGDKLPNTNARFSGPVAQYY